MSILCLIIGIVLMVGAVFFTFRPIIPSVLLSYAAMWVLSSNNHIFISSHNLLFWDIATMFVLLITMAQSPSNHNTHELGYIGVGTLSGSLVGMVVSHAGIIIGAAIGAFMGLLAFCRTPNGKNISFPSRVFISQLASKGLPTIVTMSIFATILEKLLTSYNDLSLT